MDMIYKLKDIFKDETSIDYKLVIKDIRTRYEDELENNKIAQG